MSTQTKFTPGPWYGTPRGKFIGIAGAEKAGLDIGFVSSPDQERRDECVANAYLIASATDLYAACVLADTHSKDPADEPWRVVLKAALKRARGEG